jgi:hypothetical protein
MELICTNDTFNSEQIKLIPNRPIEGSMYTIRDIIQSPQFGTGLLLNEVKNENTGFQVIGAETFTFEPNFSTERFATLNGESISSEKIKEMVRQLKHNKIEKL